jgi:hypothetical protein
MQAKKTHYTTKNLHLGVPFSLAHNLYYLYGQQKENINEFGKEYGDCNCAYGKFGR